MSAWRRIGTGDADHTVLAIDFDSTARPEAGFPQFAQLLPSRELWLTAQPDAAEKEILSVESYLDFWRDLPGGRVDTIMGYCVGGVFAPALADAVEQAQGSRPALLLVDPEPVVTASLLRDFKKTVGTMGILTEEERAAAAVEASSACEADFASAAVGIVKLYETTAGTAFDRLGLDEETSEDLLGLFRSYVSYLSAAYELKPEAGWASAVALTSAQSSPGAPHAASERSFPIGTEEMLNDERVAEAALRFFEER